MKNNVLCKTYPFELLDSTWSLDGRAILDHMSRILINGKEEGRYINLKGVRLPGLGYYDALPFFDKELRNNPNFFITEVDIDPLLVIAETDHSNNVKINRVFRFTKLPWMLRKHPDKDRVLGISYYEARIHPTLTFKGTCGYLQLEENEVAFTLGGVAELLNWDYVPPFRINDLLFPTILQNYYADLFQELREHQKLLSKISHVPLYTATGYMLHKPVLTSYKDKSGKWRYILINFNTERDEEHVEIADISINALTKVAAGLLTGIKPKFRKIPAYKLLDWNI